MPFWGDPCGDFGWSGSEHPYDYEPYNDPLAQDDDNWYEELGDATGLDTSPDSLFDGGYRGQGIFCDGGETGG